MKCGKHKESIRIVVSYFLRVLRGPALPDLSETNKYKQARVWPLGRTLRAYIVQHRKKNELANAFSQLHTDRFSLHK